MMLIIIKNLEIKVIFINDGDTYKFDDNTYTYKLFSSINTKEDFFLPTDKDGLIKHYQDDNYTCKVVDN